MFLSPKEEFDTDEAISHYPEKEQGELLTIVGDTEVGEPYMFGKGIYLSVFYCLCLISIYIQICWSNRWRNRDIRT